MRSTSEIDPAGSSDQGRIGAGWIDRARREGPDLVASAIPFLFVFYLALEGGGYDQITRGQVGIVAWWIVLLGSLMILLPAARMDRRSLIGLGVLGAFAAWTAIGLLWTESDERTVIEISRVLSLLGIFTLAVFLQREGGLSRAVVAVGSAVALVALLALGSRIAPGIFPGDQTDNLLSEANYRLLYPVGYWNSLAALIAIGLPLLISVAGSSRGLAWRTIAAASIPISILALYYTFSRGGILASAIGLAVLFALTPGRLALAIRSVIPVAGGILLVLAAAARTELADGIRGAAYDSQADQMILIVLVVVALVVAGQLVLEVLERRGVNLSPRPTRKTSQVLAGAAALIVAVGALAVGLPSKTVDAIEGFSTSGGPGQGSDRIFSSAGSNRAAYWEEALEAWESEWSTGIGPGTYEYWWARDATAEGFVRHAHSLFLQVLAETGPIGLALILALLGIILWTGMTRALRPPDDPTGILLASATAGIAAFTISAALDWSWEVTVLPAATLFLAAAVLGPDGRVHVHREAPPAEPAGSTRLPTAAILATAALAVVSIAVIYTTVWSASEIESSRILFDSGDEAGALAAADRAAVITPWAATPVVQQALILNSEGRTEEALTRARLATEKEPTNWRTWFVLVGISAVAGRPEEADRAFVRARALNPRGELFRNPAGTP